MVMKARGEGQMLEKQSTEVRCSPSESRDSILRRSILRKLNIKSILQLTYTNKTKSHENTTVENILKME